MGALQHALYMGNSAGQVQAHMQHAVTPHILHGTYMATAGSATGNSERRGGRRSKMWMAQRGGGRRYARRPESETNYRMASPVRTHASHPTYTYGLVSRPNDI